MVAAELPETAAKTVQPTTLVCSSRPGQLASQGARPLNMSSDSRVRKRISPIQMKSGRAVSVQEEAPVQIVVIMASPAGLEVKSSMPTRATPSSASATQTPEPRRRKSTKRKMPVSANSSIPPAPPAGVRPLASRPGMQASGCGGGGKSERCRFVGHNEMQSARQALASSISFGLCWMKSHQTTQ